uniref:Uncharacterized protein LOC100182238 n=1 Tax=Phallusia mammillata TaxID=59560 RepID=A0A6F9DGX9_9ASCI|nr:uncharacterized protein LOC100182238 [Phallusia mammillata]
MILFHTLVAWCVIILIGIKWIVTTLYQSAGNLVTTNQPFELGCNAMWDFVHLLHPLFASALTGLVTSVLMWIMLYFNCLDMGSNKSSQILLSPNFARYSPSQAYFQPKGLRTWCLLTSFFGSMVAMLAYVSNTGYTCC